MPTVSEILFLFPPAQYLAANDIASKGLYSGGIPGNLPRKIYMIGKSVKRVFDTNPADPTLTKTANHLYDLLGVYGVQAQAKSGSPGNIASVTPVVSASPKYFIVSGTSFLSTGESSKLIPEFRGFGLILTRNGVPQTTVITEPTYFSWDSVNYLFTCTPAVADGELIGLIPL
jgi:hypothetical protein